MSVFAQFKQDFSGTMDLKLLDPCDDLLDSPNVNKFRNQ
jgi:hypothetical protein